MTTLNTIIEEEKKDAHNKLSDFCFEEIFSDSGAKEFDRLIDTLLTTAMQRAYEAGQSEERARIRETFDDWFVNGTQDVEDWADRNLPTNQGQISR